MPLQCAIAGLLLLRIAAGAAPATAPGDAAVTLESRAADQAVQELVEHVLSLRLATGRTVATLLAPAPEVQLALRQAILTGHRRSRPRRITAGGVEMDAWLPTTQLSEILDQIVAEHLPENAKGPPALSLDAMPVVMAAGRAWDDGRPRDPRPGWRHCDARQVELARAAAALDARQALLVRLAGLRIDEDRTVAHVFADHPRFREAVEQQVAAIGLPEPVFEPTGVCRQWIHLSRADMVRLLVRAAGESAEGIDADFSRISDPQLTDALRAEGYGLAPPDDTLTGATPHADSRRPAWADEFLTSKALSRAPANVTGRDARREWAAKAARIEATRKLWMDVESLKLPDGDTIGAVLARHADAPEAFRAIDDAIVPVAMPIHADDDSATMTVGIRLETVWQVVRNLTPSHPDTAPAPSTGKGEGKK